jgi:hypothetical protein
MVVASRIRKVKEKGEENNGKVEEAVERCDLRSSVHVLSMYDLKL